LNLMMEKVPMPRGVNPAIPWLMHRALLHELNAQIKQQDGKVAFL
jgi:hypothetical protein